MADRHPGNFTLLAFANLLNADFIVGFDVSGVESVRIPAQDFLERLLTTTTIAALGTLANYAATAADDSVLLFDQSDPKIKALPFSEIRDRGLATGTLAFLTSPWSDFTAVDPTGDYFLIFDTSSTRFFRLRADTIINALRNRVALNNVSTPVTLNATTDQTVVHTQSGATAMVIRNLPALTVGMRYTFQRIAEFTFRIEPNGSEVLGGGVAGKYLDMQSAGRLEIECYVAGRGEIITQTCDIDWEP